MSDMPQSLAAWESQKGGEVLSRRFAFPSYRLTRYFMDQLATLSELRGQHPDSVNFGTTYVNITLNGHGDDLFTWANSIETIYRDMDCAT